MLNLSNHSFDYEPSLGHFRKFYQYLYKSLCENPDVSE